MENALHSELGGGNEDVIRLDRPHHIVIPALVNAHTHLDLTHIGNRPYDDDFVKWVDVIRAERRIDESEIREAVSLGITKSRHGGTAIVGDIGGVYSTVPLEVLRASGLYGVSFIELFGQGGWQPESIRKLHDMVDNLDPISSRRGGQTMRVGLQPHSPYSVGLDMYAACAEIAAKHGLRLSTHLAETLGEIEFTKQGTGPFAELLKKLERWDDTIIGSGLHPIDHITAPLEYPNTEWIVAHVNYAAREQIDRLGSMNVHVAFCPRASAYFGHANHPYREMLKCGINVCLGTDSIINLDTPERISVVDEMRLLHQRDGTDSATLLRMATVNGASGLGFDPKLVSFQKSPRDQPSPVLGIVCLPLPNHNSGQPHVDSLAASLVASDTGIEPHLFV